MAYLYSQQQYPSSQQQYPSSQQQYSSYSQQDYSPVIDYQVKQKDQPIKKQFWKNIYFLRNFLKENNISIKTTIGEFIKKIKFSELLVLKDHRFEDFNKEAERWGWHHIKQWRVLQDLLFTTNLQPMVKLLEETNYNETKFFDRPRGSVIKMNYILIITLAKFLRIKALRGSRRGNKDSFKNLLEGCCEDVDVITLEKPNQNEYYVAFKHPEGFFNHCLSFQNLMTMYENQPIHIKQQGSYSCPTCRHMIKWEEIMRDVRNFEKKILFGAGLRYSYVQLQENKLQIAGKGKQIFIFKCKDLKRQSKSKKQKSPKRQSKGKQQNSPQRKQKQKQKQKQGSGRRSSKRIQQRQKKK